jgi:hypothetical protein
MGSRHSNRGELVAGVADEHAGLPHGAVPDGDALDELGDRARRRRRAHLSPWPNFLPSSLPRRPHLLLSNQQHLVYFTALPSLAGPPRQCLRNECSSCSLLRHLGE